MDVTSLTVMLVDPLVVLAVREIKDTGYVGALDGLIVGALVGEAVGLGVGWVAK